MKSLLRAWAHASAPPNKADLPARAPRPWFRKGGFRVHRKPCWMAGMLGRADAWHALL